MIRLKTCLLQPYIFLYRPSMYLYIVIYIGHDDKT